MSPKILLSIAFLIGAAIPAIAQTDEDRNRIRRAALNYAEGWYEGSAEKMELALHPDLAKRIVRNGPEGNSRLDQMSSLTLVQAARGGYGKQTPKDQQQKDVTILDVFGGAATVKLEMRGWIDYLHIAKWNGRWVIVNVLWETKPTKAEAAK